MNIYTSKQNSADFVGNSTRHPYGGCGLHRKEKRSCASQIGKYMGEQRKLDGLDARRMQLDLPTSVASMTVEAMADDREAGIVRILADIARVGFSRACGMLACM